jgi:DNA polymerase/3'-5' exonuclease PolX
MQSLSADIQTKVLNNLGEKYLKMVERVMEDPSMQRVFDSEIKLSQLDIFCIQPSEEGATLTYFRSRIQSF